MTTKQIQETDLQSLKQLMALVKSLRAEHQGCAWTKAQTFESLSQYTLEETYEIIEAIEKADSQALCYELGDMLYHIVFYAQIAEELALFRFSDLAEAMLKKHIERRPPNVPPEATPEMVNAIWQAEKQKRRREKDPAVSLLADIPKAMPALMRALKLQQRAAEIGFDWKEKDDILQKIEEEQQELHDAIHRAEEKNILEEWGDVIFSYVNLLRHFQMDPELALMKTNEKFATRFQWMEKKANAMGKSLASFSLAEMEVLWQEAKTVETQ